MLMFLNVNTNNRADTVLDRFLQAVQKYGLPERIRSDKGGENVAFAHYILEARGPETSPVITGRSVHNQR